MNTGKFKNELLHILYKNETNKCNKSKMQVEIKELFNNNTKLYREIAKELTLYGYIYAQFVDQLEEPISIHIENKGMIKYKEQKGIVF